MQYDITLFKSPRSLKACKSQGIDPSELIQKSLNEIKEMFKGKIKDKETLELQHQHYEEKRKEKIRILLEERAEIINNYERDSQKHSKNSNVFFISILA